MSMVNSNSRVTQVDQLNDGRPLLEVNSLSTTFGKGERMLQAINGVNFSVGKGEILGLVGESGSGKSVALRSILGLSRRYGQVTGEVNWQSEDGKQVNLTGLSERAFRKVRGREIAMIFQEPMTSLNPLLTVGVQLGETLKAHTKLSRSQRQKRAVEMLDLVGIPSARHRLEDYPHQFSGGMRQRVMIAIALAANPRLLLADEPTTALDVTIQAQILDLIKSLSKELHMGVVLVTHDLGVVAQTCERVAVMYAGRIVEQGRVREVLGKPHHPYTVGLMKSVPEDVTPRTQLYSVPGTPPSLANLPKGCAYAPRCNRGVALCQSTVPEIEMLEDSRKAACFNPVNIKGQDTYSAAQEERV